MRKYVRWSAEEQSAMLAHVESYFQVERKSEGRNGFHMPKQCLATIASKLFESGFEHKSSGHLYHRWNVLITYYRNIIKARKYGVEVEWKYFDQMRDIVGEDGGDCDDGEDMPDWLAVVKEKGPESVRVPGKPLEVPPDNLEIMQKLGLPRHRRGASSKWGNLIKINKKPSGNFSLASSSLGGVERVKGHPSGGQKEPRFHLRWDGGHDNALMKALNDQRLEKRFCDVKLNCEGVDIYAHAAMLAAGSRFFATLFKRERPACVAFPETCLSHLKAVAEFIYTGEARIPRSEVDAFLVLARKLKVAGLDVDRVQETCRAVARETRAKPAVTISADLARRSPTVSNTTTHRGLKRRSKYDMLMQKLEQRGRVGRMRLERLLDSEPTSPKAKVVVEAVESGMSEKSEIVAPETEKVSGRVTESGGTQNESTSPNSADGDAGSDGEHSSGEELIEIGEVDACEDSAVVVEGEQEVVMVDQDWERDEAHEEDLVASDGESEPLVNNRRPRVESLMELWR